MALAFGVLLFVLGFVVTRLATQPESGVRRTGRARGKAEPF